MTRCNAASSALDVGSGMWKSSTSVRFISATSTMKRRSVVPSSLGAIMAGVSQSAWSTPLEKAWRPDQITPPSTGRITLFPGDGSLPLTSTLNFPTGLTLANNAILALASNASGTLGAQAFLVSGGLVDMTVDVAGYFK